MVMENGSLLKKLNTTLPGNTEKLDDKKSKRKQHFIFNTFHRKVTKD